MAKKKRSLKIKEFIFKDYIKFVLVFLFCAAFFLRTYGLFDNLFFGPEQGVDFLVIRDIAVNHNPVLVGAKTDIAGVFHGPIYYYLSVIPFLLSHGDPLFIAEFLIAINCLTVFIIYRLALELFNKRTGVIASILFTVSFGAISYSRWLSSHPLTIPLSCLFFLGLVLFLKGKRKYLFLTAATYGLVSQAEFLNYLFFGTMLGLVVLVFRKEFLKQTKMFLAVNVAVLLAIGFSNYALFELRNNLIMSKSIFMLVKSPGYHLSVLKSIQLSFTIFMQSVGGLFMPSAVRLGFSIPLLGIFLVLRSDKSIAKKVLMIWFLTPIVLLIAVRHDVLAQFFVYAIAPGILLAAFVWDRLIAWRKMVGIPVFACALVFYLFVWVRNVPADHNMFYESTQPDLRYSDELKVIDSIYSQMHGKGFSFQSYTIPYWSQQAWEYLFWQHGKRKYGYEPITANGKVLFVIVQDDPNSKHFQSEWLKKTVPKWGKQKSSFRQGIFTVRVLAVPWVK